MAWTKRELIVEAFGELALAGYVYDLTPEEMQGALRRLDAMMAAWDGKGIKLGYALTPGSSDLDQPSGLPDAAAEAVFMNLALRLAAGFGKAVTPDTRIAAKQGYDQLLARAAMPQQQQLPAGMPLGAGRRTERPFSPRPDTAPLRIGDDGNLDFIGD